MSHEKTIDSIEISHISQTAMVIEKFLKFITLYRITNHDSVLNWVTVE